MNIKMKDSNLKDIKEVKEFLGNSKGMEFEKLNKAAAYSWTEETMRKFDYFELTKKEKGIIKNYVEKITGYSRAQVARLIKKYQDSGEVNVTEYERHKFKKKYTSDDIRLLAYTTELHSYPNGASVKKNLKRMVEVYGEEKYKNISGISVSHMYNLRKTDVFRWTVTYYKGTKKSKAVGIGKREKPQPEGKPGYLRVDTIEQGSTRAGGGVYHIDTVDEKTQWQVVGSVPYLTREYMVPLLKKIIKSYPFRIKNFHADNGSEYINQYVAKLLNELLIELTKSRPRHTNDNALAETKHTIVRKCIGYDYIAKKYAGALNKFYFGSFNEYLNYHHPCAFPVEEKDSRGKVKKKYPHRGYETPYEKLKSLSGAEKYLREGLTFEMLDEIEMRYTDNEMIEKVRKERSRLFDKITAAA